LALVALVALILLEHPEMATVLFLVTYQPLAVALAATVCMTEAVTMVDQAAVVLIQTLDQMDLAALGLQAKGLTAISQLTTPVMAVAAAVALEVPQAEQQRALV